MHCGWTGHSSERGAQRKRSQNHRVEIDPRKPCHLAILSHRANGETESRAGDQKVRPQHQQQAGGEDHHAVDADTERTGFDGAARQQCRKRFWIATVGHAEPDGFA